MSNPCVYCSKLTIESLVALARQEAVGGQKHYKHHNSFSDLEAAALAGCDLCQLAVEFFHRWTLYEKAKNLKRSHVKLWIELQYLSEGSPHASERSIHGPQEVLDTIVFRVGELSLEDPHNFVEARLRLVAKEDCIPHLSPFSVYYTVEDRVLGSTSNFATVNQWLHSCEKDHPGCWPNEAPVLPTRVIDVGTLPVDVQNDQVRIFCSQGTRAKYVALSHCWGGKIEPVLESSNLARFQNSIPCSSLPATFRDAITITRNLGIQYLWIDCLCIIQDSRADWEQESNNMGPIFRDSTLGLFAATSKNSNGGILNKEPSTSLPKDAQLKVFSDPEDPTTIMASVRFFSPWESFDELWLYSALATRGWTFQEQALAPKRLVYGEKGMYWECPRSSHASKLHDPSPGDSFRRETKTIDPILHSPTPPCDPRMSVDLLKVVEEYYCIAYDYSRRALTFPSDKLPAISAIAKALSHILVQENASPTYLAGLWEMDLPRGLMWEAWSSNYAPHVSIYRAPSWSWATTDSPVIFVGVFGSRDTWSTDLRVVSCEVCPLSPGYPFGEVKSGRLVVEGRTILLKRSRQVIPARDFRLKSIGRCNYDKCLEGENPESSSPPIFPFRNSQQRLLSTLVETFGELDVSNPCNGDELEIDEASFREEDYKAVIISIANADLVQRRRETSVRGILVQRRPGSEEYERIGLLNWLEITSTWLDSIQRETLVIV